MKHTDKIARLGGYYQHIASRALEQQKNGVILTFKISIILKLDDLQTCAKRIQIGANRLLLDRAA